MTTTTIQTTVTPTQNALIAVVKAHALQYNDNGRGWDILIDMFASGDMTDHELAGIIGTTKSDFKAKNAVYKFLQPFVKLAREEAKRDAALAKIAA